MQQQRPVTAEKVKGKGRKRPDILFTFWAELGFAWIYTTTLIVPPLLPHVSQHTEGYTGLGY